MERVKKIAGKKYSPIPVNNVRDVKYYFSYYVDKFETIFGIFNFIYATVNLLKISNDFRYLIYDSIF